MAGAESAGCRCSEGAYNTRKMSRVCVTEEEARGVVLACKLFAEPDLRVKVLGKMVAALQALVGERGGAG